MIFPTRFAGKVAVVTGAAQGIGRTVALRIAREDGRLALIDDRRDAATPVGSHHYQIALSRHGGIDNCLVDVFVLDVERLAIDTR
jgi:NAD(P)-dependent dehydrogenase (short-subunit alcohol dehydrogenase family)